MKPRAGEIPPDFTFMGVVCVADAGLIEQVKIRLGISGSYHDTLIGALCDDVKAYMLSGGVSSEVLDSNMSIGCIARGVADLWNYGSGDGKFSEVFYQRVIQLSKEVASDV